MSGIVFVTSKGCAVDTTHKCPSVDISPRGIAVDCPEAIPTDARIHLHSDEYGPQRLARVRYCVQRSGLYRVGLEFMAEPH